MRLFDDGAWHVVKRTDRRAVALADRHYSRQTVGAAEFMASGKTLVMLTDDGLAVWGAIENLDPVGNLRWRVSIFRNEGREVYRSSDLIREGTERTYAWWRHKYHGAPPRSAADRNRPEEDAGEARPGPLLSARRLEARRHRAWASRA